MIKKEVQDAFNQQIKNEIESAYLYLAMAAWFKSESLDGMSQWMQAQATEEMGHAMRFHNHIITDTSVGRCPGVGPPPAGSRPGLEPPVRAAHPGPSEW